MQAGEILTRGTIWLAVTLYVCGEVARRKSISLPAWRWLNTFGCATFVAHVACAFQFYHGWSHSAAYASTARETAELFGWDSGIGLYVNYLFGLLWLAEVLWTWIEPNTYVARPVWITLIVRGFFWFMIFNGTVVFAHGAIRGYGLLLCIALLVCWLPVRKAETA